MEQDVVIVIQLRLPGVQLQRRQTVVCIRKQFSRQQGKGCREGYMLCRPRWWNRQLVEPDPQIEVKHCLGGGNVR